MIEKTLSTFHPGNIVLQQQYRNSKYQKYSELSEVLSVAEQQNEVLMSNHSTRSTGSMAVPEAHATVAERSRNRKWGRGKGKWKGKSGALFKYKGKRKPKGRFEPEKERGDHNGEKQGECYRCGARGHWSHKCCTPKHLVDLYQQSKNKGKGQHESHFITEPESQKRDDTVVNANDENVHMDGSEENLLDDMDIFGDLQ
jgi:phosphoribosyl-AMP cyclohydrolase